MHLSLLSFFFFSDVVLQGEPAAASPQTLSLRVRAARLPDHQLQSNL